MKFNIVAWAHYVVPLAESSLSSRSSREMCLLLAFLSFPLLFVVFSPNTLSEALLIFTGKGLMPRLMHAPCEWHTSAKEALWKDTESLCWLLVIGANAIIPAMWPNLESGGSVTSDWDLLRHWISIAGELIDLWICRFVRGVKLQLYVSWDSDCSHNQWL